RKETRTLTRCHPAARPAPRSRPGLVPEDLGQVPEPDVGIVPDRGQWPTIRRRRHAVEPIAPGRPPGAAARPSRPPASGRPGPRSIVESRPGLRRPSLRPDGPAGKVIEECPRGPAEGFPRGPACGSAWRPGRTDGIGRLRSTPCPEAEATWRGAFLL